MALSDWAEALGKDIHGLILTGCHFFEKEQMLPQRAMALPQRNKCLLACYLGSNMEGMTLPERTDPDAVPLGGILRQERPSRGWTLRKLAQRAGMERPVPRRCVRSHDGSKCRGHELHRRLHRSPSKAS